MYSQVIFAIAITWLICAILTVTGVFPSDPDEWGYGATTNYRIDVLNEAPWFRFPYPGTNSEETSLELYRNYTK